MPRLAGPSSQWKRATAGSVRRNAVPSAVPIARSSPVARSPTSGPDSTSTAIVRTGTCIAPWRSVGFTLWLYQCPVERSLSGREDSRACPRRDGFRGSVRGTPVAIARTMMRSIACVFLLAACGNDYHGSSTTGPDAGSGSNGYTTLGSGQWSLPASSEKYVCLRQTVDRDIYVTAISPIAPPGTHHTVLMVGPPDAPDGTTDCTSALVNPSIFASGVGTG